MRVARKGDSYKVLFDRTRAFCRAIQFLVIFAVLIIFLVAGNIFVMTYWPSILSQPLKFAIFELTLLSVALPIGWIVSKFVFNVQFSRLLLHGMIFHDEYFEKVRRGEIVIPELPRDSGARDRKGRHARDPIRSSEPFL
jgi:hypothetical protein